MERAKLDISTKVHDNPPVATYKSIDETDMEEEAVSRPRSLLPLKSTKEADGADEKMLLNEEVAINVKNQVNSNIDHPDAKGMPNEKQNGDAKLNIGETRNIFGGMDKEELLKYANDPFWVRVRWFLFIVFWLLWAGMLVGAIMIIYAAPKCDPPPSRTWWQEGPLTEIEASSTPEDLTLLNKDIKGIVVSVTDDAYGDFEETHPVVKIIKQANKLEMRVIVELDPATSSVWFERSENKSGNLSNYYIWRPPKNSAEGFGEVPNNWMNKDNQPSWRYSERRKEFYYSPLDKPHLNFRNENVTKTFSSVIEKFLEYGASGIRIRNAPLLLVDYKFEDEKTIGNNPSFDLKQHGFYAHTKTENLPELGPLLKQWRTIVRNKTVDGPFMVKEELSSMDAYRVDNALVIDLPLKEHLFSRPNISVSEVVTSLNHTFSIDNIEWPLWKVNSVAYSRDVMNIVTYLLPGVPLVKAHEPLNTELLKIRESPSIMRGICSIHSINNDTVFSYIRVTPGNPGILVAFNSLNERVTVNFPKEIPALSMLTEVTVQLYGTNYNETDFMSINAKKGATEVPISPKSAIVLSYVPKKIE